MATILQPLFSFHYEKSLPHKSVGIEIFLLCYSFKAILSFALILYTVTGLGGYLVARMLQGVSTAFFSMALQIGIIDALPEKDRSQGISLYSLFSYIPGIVVPLLALGIWQGGMEFFAGEMIGIAIITGVSGYSAPIKKLRSSLSPKMLVKV